MTLASRRQSVRDYHARRTLTGDRKVTVWLSSEARDKLALLAKDTGSKDRAAERAIMMTPTEAQVQDAAYWEDEGNAE